MRRTRKWTYIAQEATRLAGLGLSARDIARQIGVNKSTVTRWMAAGKLPKADGGRSAKADVVAAGSVQTPQEWTATVRATYALDATDEQLVQLAEAELHKAFDRKLGPTARSTAAGRFQTLVRQLALVARHVPVIATTSEAPKRQTFAIPTRSASDPRALLTAVK